MGERTAPSPRVRAALLLAAGVGVLVAVLWAAPAFACGPSIYFDSDATEGEVGEVVSVMGTNFARERIVEIRWNDQAGPVLAAATTNALGQFVLEVTIPRALPDLHEIVAVQWTETDPSRVYIMRALEFQVVDETAPVWPDGATLASESMSEDAIGLVWPPATDVSDDVTYEVAVDGEPVAVQDATSLEVSGLEAGASYTFSVVASDPFGNTSVPLVAELSTAVPEPPVAEPPSAEPPASEEPDPSEEPAPLSCEGTAGSSAFTDIAGSAHRGAIECAAWHGGVRGTSATTFGPAAGVRRDQMASFVARLLEVLGVALPAQAPVPFADVAGNTHAEAIGQLAALGVVQGTSASTYDPAGLVRRDQMASFLVRAGGLVMEGLPAAGSSPFADVAGNTHAQAIGVAYEAGFVRGTSATAYAPAATVRRDQMAAFLTRVLTAAGG